MFITIKLGALVRTVLLVLTTFVVLFLALANTQQTPTVPQPQQPPPAEKAHALVWDRTETTMAW